MNAIGIIFANLHEKNIPELTSNRTIGSVPFGCRYRLIDFSLSNMVNSGITDIRVVTQANYASLMDHIGSGMDWDLARRSGGIKVLPPNARAQRITQTTGFTTRLESLRSIRESIEHIKQDYVIMADCESICNIDLNVLLQDHIKNNADITMMVKRMPYKGAQESYITLIDSDTYGNITDISNPVYVNGEYDTALNITVISRRYLRTVIDAATAYGYTSLTHDIMAKNIGRRVYRVYRYDGPFASLTSFAEYFQTSMELIRNKGVRDALFGVATRPILTKIRNSPPTRYIEGSSVKNSLIADGCTIDGTVENSILFRGVKVERGAVVKNCILFQDTVVGENVFASCVVSDKNAVIKAGNVLAGHPSKPYYIGKNQIL